MKNYNRRNFLKAAGITTASLVTAGLTLPTSAQTVKMPPKPHLGNIVIISTPWEWHAPMAIDTMENGKHAFVEVPLAMSVEECWQIVDTAERTKKTA